MPDIYEKIGKRYKPRPDIAALAHFDARSLIVGAQRYYIGRTTIHASVFAAIELASAWPALDGATQGALRGDIEEQFRRDDEARAEGSDYKPLGWDSNRAAWAKVRAHWHGKDTPLAPHVPTRAEILHRLRAIAEQMQELGAAMEYAGGFDGRMAARGWEMQGAGQIAQSWALEIAAAAEGAP